MSERTWNKLKSATSLIGSVINECRSHINLEQLISLTNTLDHHTIVISGVKKPGMVNISEEQLHLIVRAAKSHRCANCLEAMNERDWKNCDLRRLFDEMPVRSDPSEVSNVCLGLCPYAKEDDLDED